MHRKHIASIAGLRALAVLFVLLFHVNPSWLSAGFVGVDVFFVISGFVVAHSVAGTSYPSFKAYFGHFYVRRFRRILPASFVYIAVALVATTLFIPLAQPTKLFEMAGASAVVGVSNIFLLLKSGDYFAEASDLNPFTHTWSLAVEEQYYLIFPSFSYFLLVARDRFPRAKIVAMSLLAAAIVASMIASYHLTATSPTFAFYMLPTRFWELGLGFLLRYLLDRERPAILTQRLSHAGSALGVLGLLGLLLAATITPETSFPFPGALLPCLSTALAITAVWCHPGGIADRALSQRMLVFFGDISYSLYLWHWGVLVLMRWTCGVDTLPLQVAAMVMSVLLGWLSYRFVEQGFHNRETRGRAPNARLFLSFGAVGGALCLACWVMSAVRPQIGLAKANDVAVWDPYRPPPLAAACPVVREQAGLGKGIMSHFVAECAKPSLPRMFVLGDSHAGAYQRAIWRIAAEARVEPYLLTMGGCRLVYLTATPPVSGCETFRATALERIFSLARPGDVIFLPGLHTTRYESNGGAIRQSDRREIAQSRQRLASLAPLGVSVIVEGPKPVMPASMFRCGDWFNAFNPVCAKMKRYGPADNWARMNAMMPSFTAVAAGMPHVTVWYPSAILCFAERCPPTMNGQPLYFDTDHLTAYGNDLLQSSLSAVIYKKARRPIR